MADPTPLEALKALVNGFEESVRLCREAAAIPDMERASLGLIPLGELEQVARRIRLEVLEGVLAKAKETLEKTQLAAGGCDIWVEMNGTRFVCEHPLGHEGEHQRKITGRAGRQRIDATLTWTLGTYLQPV